MVVNDRTSRLKLVSSGGFRSRDISLSISWGKRDSAFVRYDDRGVRIGGGIPLAGTVHEISVFYNLGKKR